MNRKWHNAMWKLHSRVYRFMCRITANCGDRMVYHSDNYWKEDTK